MPQHMHKNDLNTHMMMLPVKLADFLSTNPYKSLPTKGHNGHGSKASSRGRRPSTIKCRAPVRAQRLRIH